MEAFEFVVRFRSLLPLRASGNHGLTRRLADTLGRQIGLQSQRGGNRGSIGIAVYVTRSLARQRREGIAFKLGEAAPFGTPALSSMQPITGIGIQVNGAAVPPFRVND